MMRHYWPIVLVTVVIAAYAWMFFHPDTVYRPLACLPAGLTLIALKARDFHMGGVWMRSGWIRRSEHPGLFWWGNAMHLFATAVIVSIPLITPDSRP